MVTTELPRPASATLVVGLMVATGMLAGGAVVTSLDTLVPLVEGEPWASARGLIDGTYALQVQAIIPDDHELDRAGHHGEESKPCIRGELPVQGLRIEVRWPGPSAFVPGPVVAAADTDENGGVTFDLRPGRYVLHAQNDTKLEYVTLDTDKVASFEAEFRRSIRMSPENHTDAATTAWFGMSRGSEWIVFDRATYASQGPGHTVSGGFWHMERGTDHAEESTNVVAKFERLDSQGAVVNTWIESWNDARTWHILLQEGFYRLNVTWESGQSTESEFEVSGRTSIRTDWRGDTPTLIVRDRYPVCAA